MEIKELLKKANIAAVQIKKAKKNKETTIEISLKDVEDLVKAAVVVSNISKALELAGENIDTSRILYEIERL